MVTKKPKGLGRGLEALLGPTVDDSAASTSANNPGLPASLLLGDMVPGQYQPRTRMDEGALYELAESIKAQGIMQPILVRRLNSGANSGKYEIIAGERRFRAARLAGLDSVPVLVRDVPDEAAAAMALIENIQREDLNPLEEAQGLQRLIKEFGMTHETAAQAVGRSRSAASNLLRLLNLAEPVQTMLMAGDIDMGHARALLALDRATQITAASQIAAKKLSVREAEALVKKINAANIKVADGVEIFVEPVQDYRFVVVMRGDGLQANIDETDPQRTGVPPGHALAIWGMETAFGSQRGNQNMLSSIATLAYDCRRSAFFTEHLYAALQLIDRGALQATVPDTLDPLSRSDREAAIEDWLDARGVDRAWELAGPILSLNLEIGDLDALAGEIDADALSSVVSLMTHSYTAFALLAQVGHGSEQISEIVKALKDYSFMDQAPVQEIDLHEGLNNTLIMLQAKLKRGIEVERNYGEDVPRIDALGSELNQVWTNLIDNAADAMGGSGHLMITTSADDGWVVVEIEDDGPGIADDLIDKVFEPFLTTKGPGKGTGLGLNIVFNIIRGSGGHIDVRSKPGSTVFRVRLPVRREAR